MKLRLFGDMLTASVYKAFDGLFIELLLKFFDGQKPIDAAAYNNAYGVYADRCDLLLREVLENPPKDISTSRDGKQVRHILLTNLPSVTSKLKSKVSLPAWTFTFSKVVNDTVCPLLSPLWVPVSS
jgi:hypothetical protein